MAFSKPLVTAAGGAASACSNSTSEIDIWSLFRALRDARSVFGLRSGHIQTLQAMLSFLKPGQGETVFASNYSICQRANGIDERTLRRHINRFMELGFIKRSDSPNRKRYRVRASSGESVSYGLSLAPLLRRASEFFDLAQTIERNRRDQIFIRKQILTKLAHLEEHDPASPFITATRKTLRRKLSITEYRALLTVVSAKCDEISVENQAEDTAKESVNDGQIDRHLSKSEIRKKDLENTATSKTLRPEYIASVCDIASSFTTDKLENWQDIEQHARTLAPMMGIDPRVFEKAKNELGQQKAASAIFIVLQLGERVKDFGAYFHSITLGRHQHKFDPSAILQRLANDKAL